MKYSTINKHLLKQLKRKIKELNNLKEIKFNSLSSGTEKKAYLDVLIKEVEIKTMREIYFHIYYEQIKINESKKVEI